MVKFCGGCEASFVNGSHTAKGVYDSVIEKGVSHSGIPGASMEQYIASSVGIGTGSERGGRY